VFCEAASELYVRWIKILVHLSQHMGRLRDIDAPSALLQIMPFITSATYTHERARGDRSSEKREIDFVLNSRIEGMPSLAAEHIPVDAHGRWISEENDSFDAVAEIAARCSGKLPSDRYYYLIVPDQHIVTLRRNAFVRFIEAVWPWILKAAPALRIDGYANMHYEDNNVLLVCGGSHPMTNGTIGRIPRRPNSPESLVAKSLWHAIECGLGNFAKHKRDGFETVLSLHDVSSQVRPSMLIEIENDREKEMLVSGLVDYVIAFTFAEDGTTVGNIWKEKDLLYDPSPLTRRFSSKDDVWSPIE
jgi:hypothetical protein